MKSVQENKVYYFYRVDKDQLSNYLDIGFAFIINGNLYADTIRVQIRSLEFTKHGILTNIQHALSLQKDHIQRTLYHVFHNTPPVVILNIENQNLLNKFELFDSHEELLEALKKYRELND